MSDQQAFDNSIADVTRKVLEVYRKSVFAEMYYLRDNGGRKYKVTNGRLISNTIAGFAYGFDMESELFLAPDSPVSIDADGRSVNGSILSCEDFQVIVILEENIGAKVPFAFMSVEPWKLLESLNAKLVNINPGIHSIAMELIQKGPALKTGRPIIEVATGQDAAMDHVLNNRITIIWGPPGTGKTYTMAEIAIKMLMEGKTVLAVSHSNISVDGIVLKVAEQMREKGMDDYLVSGYVMRFGHVRDNALAGDQDVVSYNYALRGDPALQEKLKSLQNEKVTLRKKGKSRSERMVKIEQEIRKIRKIVSDKEEKAVGQARMVATTASRLYANGLFEDKKYDVVMFDEVSMAYVPQVFCAAMFAREKMVCVGDFRQLAPIAQGKASRKTLSRDLFWYLGICDTKQEAHAHPWLVMLDEQRRMQPDIAAFPSSAFYGRLLKDHQSVIDRGDALTQVAPYPGESMSLVDLTGTYCTASKNSDNSRFNILSAMVSFAIALSAEEDLECSAGIIAPYVAQARLVRAMVEDYRERKKKTSIACSTVHQFQGSERDVIVLDMVESFPSKKPGVLTTSNENGSVDRLINVAVTRARNKLVTVASRLFWERSFKETRNSFAALVGYYMRTSEVAKVSDGTLADLLDDLEYGPNISHFGNVKQAMKKFMYDIDHSADKIVFVLPDGRLDDKYSSTIYESLREARRRKVTILLKSASWRELPEDWKGLGWPSPDADCPIVIIDKTLVWYGMPPSRGKLVDDKGSGVITLLQTPFRIEGKRTVDMICSLTDAESRVVKDHKQTLTSPSTSAKRDEDGKGEDGLALYIKQHIKCTKCGFPMKLARGWKSGKFFMKCSKCDEIAYLDKNEVNHYISISQVKCPTCKSYLTAGVGKHGFYIRCDRGHFIGADEI